MLQSIKSIPLTLYSRKFYADLILRWKGLGIGFILIAIFLNFAAPLLMQLPELPKAQQEIERVVSQMPEITIKKAKLSIDQPSPYMVKAPLGNNQNFTIVFDTNYQENNVDELSGFMKDHSADILVTADYIATHSNRNSSGIRIQTFKELAQNNENLAKENFVITYDDWTSFGKKAATFLPVIFVLALIPVFLLYLVFAFFKALIVKFVSIFFDVHPDLSGAMRLGVAASIPASIIMFIFAIIGAFAASNIAVLPPFAATLLWFAFVFFGLYAINKEKQGESGK